MKEGGDGLLRAGPPWGDIGGHRRMAMIVLSPRRTLLSLSLVVAQCDEATGRSWPSSGGPLYPPRGGRSAIDVRAHPSVRWSSASRSFASRAFRALAQDDNAARGLREYKVREYKEGGGTVDDLLRHP